METRPLGDTGHHSTVAILGAFAFSEATREETDRGMELVLEAGINHIDIAPSYGHAEEMLGPWMTRERERFFLGCKTMERSKTGAARELRESLERLQTDHFDLYQIHAVTTDEDLDQVLAPGGALEALLEARERGLTRHLGITGHGIDIPRIMLRALDEFAFDTVLFPINYIQYTDPTYRLQAEKLVRSCRERGVGTMIIKSIARGEWGEQQQRFNTWYEPFDDQDHIQDGVNFALSQDVTGICTAGDLSLLPKILQACRSYRKLSDGEQQALIEEGKQHQPLFPLEHE